MKAILRFVFEHYEQVLKWTWYKLLLVIALLMIVPVGVPTAIFFIVGIGGCLSIVNISIYAGKALWAYAYNLEMPRWQGFIHS